MIRDDCRWKDETDAPPMKPLMRIWIYGLYLFLIGLLLSGGVAAEPIRLKSIEFDPAEPILKSQLAISSVVPETNRAPLAGEKRLLIMQADGPIDNAMLAAWREVGVEPIAPVPEQAYLVSAPTEISIAEYKSSLMRGRLRWAGEMAPTWKLHPQVGEAMRRAATTQSVGESDKKSVVEKSKTPELDRFRVQFAHTGGEKRLRQKIRSLTRDARLHSRWERFETWTIEADPGVLGELAVENAVYWIEPYREPRLLGERGALSLSGLLDSEQDCLEGAAFDYQAWLNSIGLDGSGVTVHVMDDGLSQGIATNAPGTAHPDILGRIVGIDNSTNDALGDSGGGHGHINASIIMGQPIAGGGRVGPNGFLLGQGVAPQARVHATKVFSNGGRFELVDDISLADLVTSASKAGARISSNSWGASTGGTYDSDSQLFDRLTRDADLDTPGRQPMLFCFAAGNDGSSANTVGSPATAKNVIAVGAGENCDGGETDGCGVGPASSDDLRDIARFSSRGPLDDGRLSPTLVAPGTHVTGAASDSPVFDGSAVCGREFAEVGEPSGNRIYYPANQFDYTWSSGTSHSTPIVAGAAVLLYQYFSVIEGQGASPALLKAALVAGTVDNRLGKRNDNTGELVGPLPNNHAGWGRAELSKLVDSEIPQFWVDQETVLRSPGESASFDFQVVDSNRPLKVVLVWTDAAASVFAAQTLVNDLDLEVSLEQTTWLGNVFSDGFSVPGGSADRLNNIEVVHLTAPQPGIYTLTVRAHEINGDAIPGEGSDLEQDFAVYVLNGAEQTPVGQLNLDRAFYNCSDQVTINVSDSDLVGTGTIQVLAESPDLGDVESVTLTETTLAGGILQGSIVLTDSPSPPGDGQLQVADASQIEVTYEDASTGPGGEPRTVEAKAQIDCQPPQVLRQSIIEVTDSDAVLEVESDSPVALQVEWGTQCGVFDSSLRKTVRDVNHEVILTGLQPCTPYYYRILLTDEAGNESVFGGSEECNVFETLDVVEGFSDDLEPQAEPGWNPQLLEGTGNWTQTETALARSPNHTWFIAGTDAVKDAVLEIPPLLIEQGARLVFWHTFELERSGVSIGFDGAVVEISNDGGATWIDLGTRITEGGYNTIISSDYSNPLGDRAGWSGGTLGEMKRVAIDLTDFRGQTVRVRFRLGCDSSIASTGWYLDDITIEQLVACQGDLAEITFESDWISCESDRIEFTLRDNNLIGAPPVDAFELARPATGEGVPVTINDLSFNASLGRWEGTLPLSPGTIAGSVRIGDLLEVNSGERVQLNYRDPDVQGQVQTVFTQAMIDCLAPQLVQTMPVFFTDEFITVFVESSEPVAVTVRYGLECGQWLNESTISAFDQITYIGMFDLIPCETYVYQIELSDPAGNVSVFDDNGSCYSASSLMPQDWSDDLEPTPSPAWTRQTPQGQTGWQAVETELAKSPTHAWFNAGEDMVKDSYLITPPVAIAPDAELRFWHTYEIEQGFDGGVIEISLDGGQTWLDMGDDIARGQYDTTISGNFGSPIAGRSAWTGGTLGTMTEVVVELDDYVGVGRLIRFRHACDDSLSEAGWYVDDIIVDGFTACDPAFPHLPLLINPTDGADDVSFSQPVTLDWSEDSRADVYRVLWGFNNPPVNLLETTTESQSALPSTVQKAGTRIFWRVEATNELGTKPSLISQFRIQNVDRDRFLNALLGESPGLSAEEREAVDYDEDGQVLINDLITNVNRTQASQ